MGHGSYNSTPPHGPWVVRQYIHPMHHGSYDSTPTPWVMDRTTASHPHGSWIVRRYIFPCTMDRTTMPRVHILHASWVVRQNSIPMGHGLYDSTHFPWAMGRTTVYFPIDHGSYDSVLSHRSWVVQQCTFPWIMGRTVAHKQVM